MYKKTIVITGSTRGIGHGLAIEFLKRGHQVVINGRNKDKVNEVILELMKINPEVIGVCGSVGDTKTHRNLVEKSLSTFDKIDIWINNAGIPQPNALLHNIEDSAIKKLIETNIYGMMIGSKIAVNLFLKQGYGKLFNMEGFGSNGRTMRKLTLYGTSKRAVNYFTKSLSLEIKKEPIQIGSINPGMVRTAFLNGALIGTPEEIKQYKKVYDILAEDVEKVTPLLADKILKSTKDYDSIQFLTKFRLFLKIIKLITH